jgi:sugar fermentation stimulation protein A
MKSVVLKHNKKLIPATFLKRPNRFLAQVLLDGEETIAHVPDPGRLKELLLPGVEVFLRPASGARKTKFDLVLVNYQGTLVSLDSILPNRLVEEALKRGFFQELVHYPQIRREVTYSESRLDFCLSNSHDKCFIEVKSVTLVQDKIALFPDAPTIRGARHLRELIRAKQEGMRAISLFIIQRDDAVSFSPHREMDPIFASTLKEAHSSGVEVWAYKCKLSLDDIILDQQVAVEL